MLLVKVYGVERKRHLYILDNRLGSSSMYMPNVETFDLHNIPKKDFNDYKVTRIRLNAIQLVISYQI